MNKFKKIGAAVLASALTATTAITASANSANQYYSFQMAHTDTQNAFLVSPIPENALECDEITLYTIFTTVKIVDGDLKYDHSHQYQIIGWYTPGNPEGGYWAVYDNVSRKYITGNGTGGNMKLIQSSEGNWGVVVYSDFGNMYIDDILNNSNAVQVGIMGTKNGQNLWYLPNGSTWTEQVTSFNLLKEPEREPTTSDPTSSEPATSEPTTSEPATSEPTASEPATSEPTASEPATSEPTASEPATSEPTASEPTTSEPTASEPTTSEPTTSEPTTSEPTTSEPTTSEPSNENNPATGFGMAMLPITLLGGASIIVFKKRK